MKELETTLAGWFGKLPNLPQSARDILVKLAPYFAIIGLVLSLPVILFFLGLGALASPILALGGAWSTLSGGMLGVVYAIASVVLLGLSIKGLFARSASGWQYMYYNALLGAAYSILQFDIAGLIIGTGISMYILFQVKSSYK